MVTHTGHEHGDSNFGRFARWIFHGFLAVAAFFLVTEHRAHLYGILPYLLLAACPLMHLFHRHCGAHGSRGGSPGAQSENQDKLPAGRPTPRTSRTVSSTTSN